MAAFKEFILLPEVERALNDCKKEQDTLKG